MIRWFSGREISVDGRRNVFKLELNATEFRNNMAALGATDGWVFIAICTFMDKDGFCFPSTQKLADMTGLSRRTVTTSIANLCRKNIGDLQRPLLVRIHRTGAHGRYGSNGYYILPDKVPPCAKSAQGRRAQNLHRHHGQNLRSKIHPPEKIYTEPPSSPDANDPSSPPRAACVA